MRLGRLFTPTRLVIVAATVVAALTGALLTVPAQLAAADTAPGAQFVASAGRILDTRNGTGGYKTAMPANTWRTVQVTGKAGVPSSSSVTAVALNLTEVSPSGLGQVSVRPNANTAATLVGTFDGGDLGTTSNQADVAVNSDGTIQVETNASTQLVADVEGYYSADSSAAGGYVPIAGKRYVGDQAIAANGNYTVQITGVNGIPTNATAVVADFVVKNKGTDQGYIAPGPAGSSVPTTSLSYPGVTNVATAISAHVQLSADGKLEVWNRNGTAIAINIDIEGYFVPGSSTAGSFTPGSGRAYDTRVKPHVSVPKGKTITVPLGGTHGVPSTSDGLSSVVVDLIAIHASTDTAGFARAWADGTAEPNISDVEYAPNSIRSNTNTVPVGLDGAIEIHNLGTAPVDFVVDIEGWYAGASSTMCANDTDTILGSAATSAATIGAATGAPVVSAVLSNSLNNDVNAEIYLVDGSGNPVAGLPAATGSVTSGTSLIYHLPTTHLVTGATYTWWIHAFQNDVCASSATGARHTFTMGSTPTSEPDVQQLTLTGAQLTTRTALVGATDCGGSACPLTPGLSVGSDSSGSHEAAIAPDLSSLPTGARITAATLQLTSSCLAASCMSGTLSIAEASDDVKNPSTGAQLAAISTQTPLTFTEAGTGSNTYDVTSIAQDWQDFGSSEAPGLLLAETNTSANSGAQFNDSGASSGAATLTISYIAPTVPSAVTQLTALPGDGGTLVTWAEPDDTGWHDADGNSDGVSNYTVTATAPDGEVAASSSSAGPRATLTGLINGTAYVVSVVANNPVGSSAAETVQVRPASVTGGPAKYVGAVQDLLNAQTQLEEGNAQSTQDAAGSASNPAATATGLGSTAPIFQNVYSQEVLSNQADINDTTQLTNSLAVQTGDTVTLYTSAHETFTTADTSAGNESDIQGQDSSDQAYIFPATTGAPIAAQTLDGDALTEIPTASTADTFALPAAPAIADPPPPSDATTTATTVDARHHFTVNTGLATRPTVHAASAKYVSRSGVAAWADQQWNGSYNGFSEDCTDFVSRALHNGGGLSEIGTPYQAKANADNGWYFTTYRNLHTGYSAPAWARNWSMANWSPTYHHNRGGTWVSTSNASAGDIIYASWYDSNYSNIGHAGVISLVTGSNIYIDQHSTEHYREPLYKVSGNPHTWQGWYSHVHVWILNPAGER